MLLISPLLRIEVLYEDTYAFLIDHYSRGYLS